MRSTTKIIEMDVFNNKRTNEVWSSGETAEIMGVAEMIVRHTKEFQLEMTKKMDRLEQKIKSLERVILDSKKENH